MNNGFLGIYFLKLYDAFFQSFCRATTNINGKAISSIFESDGITARKATNAMLAYDAEKAQTLNNIFQAKEILNTWYLLAGGQQYIFNFTLPQFYYHIGGIVYSLDWNIDIDIPYFFMVYDEVPSMAPFSPNGSITSTQGFAIINITRTSITVKKFTSGSATVYVRIAVLY